MRALLRYTAVVCWAPLVSRTAPLSAQPRWTIDTQTVTVIRDDPSTGVTFGRVAGAIRTASGDVLVADMSSTELRRFGANGLFRNLVARSGQGPGEMSSVRAMKRAGSGVMALATFDYLLVPAIGRPERRAIPSLSGPSAGLLDLGPSGYALTARTKMLVLTPPTRLRRDTAELTVVMAGEGNPRLSLGKYPNQTSLIVAADGLPGGIKFGRLETAPQLFTSATDSVVWIADGETPELVRISVPAGVRKVISVAIARRNWTAQALARWRTHLLSVASTRADEVFVDAQMSATQTYATTPFFAGLYPDIDGGVWMEVFSMTPGAPAEYLAYSPAGVLRARVKAPRNGRLLDISERHVVFSEMDESGVERVVVYPLRRRNGL